MVINACKIVPFCKISRTCTCQMTPFYWFREIAPPIEKIPPFSRKWVRARCTFWSGVGGPGHDRMTGVMRLALNGFSEDFSNCNVLLVLLMVNNKFGMCWMILNETLRHRNHRLTYTTIHYNTVNVLQTNHNGNPTTRARCGKCMESFVPHFVTSVLCATTRHIVPYYNGFWLHVQSIYIPSSHIYVWGWQTFVFIVLFFAIP